MVFCIVRKKIAFRAKVPRYDEKGKLLDAPVIYNKKC